MHSTFITNNNLRKYLLVIAIIINLFAINNVSFSQGRRHLDKYGTGTYTYKDSLRGVLNDSLKAIEDSLRNLPVDSTARIKYFTYEPEYTFGTSVVDKTHPLLLGNSSHVKYDITFDKEDNVIIKQTFLDEDIKAPLVIPLEEYINELAQINQKEIFSELVSEKFKGVTTDDLSQFFEKFTDITIPLPFKTETIFGPPTINLKINGAIDITASYENIKSDQQTVSFTSSNQNNINFKQEVQVTAKGTVGDKLTIDADWNTQRTFDFENQLKIKYTGYADEVIQKIEAGNVSLDTKSSLIQSTQALFGIKGEFKLGPLTLSTVVSQKKSKQETKDYVGGSQEQIFNIAAYEYSDNHYFLDTLYKSSFLDVFNNTSGVLAQSTYNNRVLSNDISFEVWVQTEVTEIDKRYAVAYTQLYEEPAGGYIDTLIQTGQEPGIRFFGYFRQLTKAEYMIHENAGFLTLKINVPDNYHIGVVYRTNDFKKYGKGRIDVGAEDTLLLKMIKTANQSPDGTPLAWELKMKNIYRLPVSKVVEDGFELQIKYDENGILEPRPPGAGLSKDLTEILGLDRFQKNSRNPPADGLFDYLPGFTLNLETGDVIFPTLEPFRENLIIAGLSDSSSFVFDELYSQRKSVAQNLPIATKYRIYGKAKGEAGISNVINLGFNVVHGSVKVFIGTQELKINEDYVVDYGTGTVTIRSATALTSSDLKVTYETNDLFQLASKTLIGLRADYELWENTNVGFTFVNLKQETLNDKVRIGEEPTNNSMFGLDLSTEIKSKFLTNLVNFLPGYNTKEESSFTLKGELAAITPDPNTKRSQIPQDNNESIAYVDDMEGAKKILTLGTSYSGWTLSSLPEDSTIADLDSIKQIKRGRMRWYNIPNNVEIKTVFPKRDVQPGQETLTPFYIQFDPRSRGVYNYNEKFDSIPNIKTNWNGIMKYLNTTTTDLINENINFIEFNMHIENFSTLQSIDLTDAELIIELGSISEDAIPNGRIDSEDKTQTGIFTAADDIGLDYLTNAQELDTFNARNNTSYTFANFPYGPDPALDDNLNTGVINYDIINGTQDNRGFEGKNKPDTEDLDRNGALDDYNSYYKYIISLDTTNNQMISGRGKEGSGWFQYRIPLSEFSKAINNPTLTNVEYARVWIKGVDEHIRIALVEFNLVGNQWFKPDKEDTTYNISVVSIEENPQIYQSPVAGDILRQTVRNTSGVDTKSNEQSLSIQVSNLVRGDRKLAIKDYQTRTIDLFNYKQMKLFINGDPSFNYVNENTYDAAMVIRFGSDSNNFYEYRAPIHPDMRPGQPWNSLNEVTIVFSDLTSIKIQRDSVNQVVDIPVPNGPPGAYYRIRGSPDLQMIREFELGVECNRSALNSSISGSVWFNEIRVLNVNDEAGFAFNLTAGVQFADFANFGFSFQKQDPNFHALDLREGTRYTGQSWDFSGTINVHKLINNALVSVFSDEWKDFITLPLSFRHTESLTNPKYYPGTDIELEKAAEEKYKKVLAETNNETLASRERENMMIEAQTLEVRNNLSLNGLAFKFPGNNYLINNILNTVTANFTASFRDYRDVTYENQSDFTYNGDVSFNPNFDLVDNFNISLGKLLFIGEEYKDAKLYFCLPFIPLTPLFSSDFNASTDFNRSENGSKQRRYEYDDPTGRSFTANRGFGFKWKFIENWIVDLTGTYDFRAGSNLTPLLTYNDSLNTPRPESEVFGNIFFNKGLINFGDDLDYTQTTVFNPKFNFPVINKFLDLNLDYSAAYGWINPNTTTNIGYNVRYQTSINAGTNFKISEILSLFGSGSDIQKSNYKGGGQNSNGKISDDKQSITDVFKLLATFIPDNINASYNQSNTVSNPGVEGRPGFGNFWMNPSTNEELGPSRFYQLGLSMFPGKRVPNLTLTDAYSQTNTVTFTTTINPIFPEAIRMNLTFKSNWGFNNTASYISTHDGTLTNPTNKSNSYTSGHSMFFSGNVEELRFESSTDPDVNLKNISAAFENNIASFPFPNWSLTISGVEKFPMFAQFATSVTFENNFSSEYSKGFSVDNRNIEIPVSQTITQSFNPLFGMNITFKEMLGGSMTASFRINNSVTNRLVPSSNLIQTTNTYDWSLTANFAKAGFEIPLFGLSLKNDISFDLTISKNVNNPTDYIFTSDIPDKLPGNGSSVFTVNPSIQYSLSSKVQMQLFYKYIKTEPTQGTVNTVPRTSNEGGLNIRISIQ